MLQPVNQPNEGRRSSGPTGVELEPKATKFPGVVLNKWEKSLSGYSASGMDSPPHEAKLPTHHCIRDACLSTTSNASTNLSLIHSGQSGAYPDFSRGNRYIPGCFCELVGSDSKRPLEPIFKWLFLHLDLLFDSRRILFI
ncbi:hypothetical protein ACMYSQ_006004 [Aspergillus niger]